MSERTLFTPHGNFLAYTLAQGDVSHPALLSPTPPPEISLDDGARVTLAAAGVLRIEPAVDTPRQIIISAGIHGNETAPIEVCDRLVSELLEQRWAARVRMLVILGNPPAMVAGKRFVDFNLNRLFSGTHSQPEYAGCWETDRAALLENLVRDFTREEVPLLHYDLHTAIRDSQREKFALYPYVPDRQLPLEQMQFLLESDVDTVLYQHVPGSTFASWTSTEFLAESFTVELGKVRPFGQNDSSRFRGIENSLRRLMQGQSPGSDLLSGQEPPATMAEFQVVHEILNTGRDFVFYIPDDVANFTEYAPGTLIWEDARTQYRVGSQPEAIVFPNPQVPVGQRVGLLVSRI